MPAESGPGMVSPGMVSDEALMGHLAAGDEDALGELYDRHAQTIYNYFWRRLRRVEPAQDLTQEVFLALARLGSRYEPRAPFFALLYGIARRLLAKERRRLGRAGLPLGDGEPEAPAGAAELELAVRQALERLPERRREPLMLFVYEQLSYEEIARLIGRPIGTVRSRIARARVQLAAMLKSQPPGGSSA